MHKTTFSVLLLCTFVVFSCVSVVVTCYDDDVESESEFNDVLNDGNGPIYPPRPDGYGESDDDLLTSTMHTTAPPVPSLAAKPESAARFMEVLHQSGGAHNASVQNGTAALPSSPTPIPTLAPVNSSMNNSVPTDANIREVSLKLNKLKVGDYPDGSSQRTTLEQQVIRDIEASAGIPHGIVTVITVSGLDGAGSGIIMSLRITPKPEYNHTPVQIAKVLEQLVKNKDSMLYNEKREITSLLDPNYFVVDTSTSGTQMLTTSRTFANGSTEVCTVMKVTHYMQSGDRSRIFPITKRRTICELVACKNCNNGDVSLTASAVNDSDTLTANNTSEATATQDVTPVDVNLRIDGYDYKNLTSTSSVKSLFEHALFSDLGRALNTEARVFSLVSLQPGVMLTIRIQTSNIVVNTSPQMLADLLGKMVADKSTTLYQGDVTKNLDSTSFASSLAPGYKQVAFKLIKNANGTRSNCSLTTYNSLMHYASGVEKINSSTVTVCSPMTANTMDLSDTPTTPYSPCNCAKSENPDNNCKCNPPHIPLPNEGPRGKVGSQGSVGAKGAAGDEGIQGATGPSATFPQQSAELSAIRKHISAISNNVTMTKQRLELLKQRIAPKWSRAKYHACPDEWRWVMFNATTEKVYCDPPSDHLRYGPFNSECRHRAEFPKKYDRCGWSIHCKAPWAMYNCTKAWNPASILPEKVEEHDAVDLFQGKFHPPDNSGVVTIGQLASTEMASNANKFVSPEHRGLLVSESALSSARQLRDNLLTSNPAPSSKSLKNNAAAVVKDNSEESFDYKKLGDDWGAQGGFAALCRNGTSQSPIDIVEPKKSSSQPSQVVTAFKVSTKCKLRNTGHSMQIDTSQNCNLGTALVDDITYVVSKVRFRSGAEHTIQGKKFAMEMQVFAQKGDDGGGNGSRNTIILSYLFNLATQCNGALNAMNMKDWPTVDNGEVNLSSFSLNDIDVVKSGGEYYSYTGSFTQPPCTEGVSWRIMKRVGTVCKEQVNTMHNAFPLGVARRTQPLNQRAITVGRTTTTQ